MLTAASYQSRRRQRLKTGYVTRVTNRGGKIARRNGASGALQVQHQADTIVEFEFPEDLRQVRLDGRL